MRHRLSGSGRFRAVPSPVCSRGRAGTAVFFYNGVPGRWLTEYGSPTGSTHVTPRSVRRPGGLRGPPGLAARADARGRRRTDTPRRRPAGAGGLRGRVLPRASTGLTPALRSAVPGDPGGGPPPRNPVPRVG